MKKENTQKDTPWNKNKRVFRLGYSIAELMAWNSQEKFDKDYIFNRRVPYSGDGSLLGLSNPFRKSQPIQYYSIVPIIITLPQ
jgi:hypothetical protein